MSVCVPSPRSRAFAVVRLCESPGCKGGGTSWMLASGSPDDAEMILKDKDPKSTRKARACVGARTKKEKGKKKKGVGVEEWISLSRP